MIEKLDNELSLAEKLQLIQSIEAAQEKRRRRINLLIGMRKQHPGVVYILMKRQISLIRTQDARLNALKKSLNN